MKKLLIIILLTTGLAGTAVAQNMWLSGTMRLRGSALNSQSENSLTLIPEFGYNLDGPWSVGGQIGFHSEWTTVNNNTRRENMTSIIPFLRYGVGEPNSISFFVQGELPLNFYGGEDFDGTSFDSSTSVGLTLRPGMYYSFTERWGVTMYMPPIFFIERHDDLTVYEFAFNHGYTIQGYLLSTAFGITYNF
jgi:hypothetical protein